MGEIIRRAEQKDIPRLVELGEEFATLSQPIHKFSVDRESIIEFANHVVNNTGCAVYVLEVDGLLEGFIAGLLQKIYFSKDIALQELAWYVKPGFKGLGLLFAFEAYAAEIGCQHIILGNKPAYYDLSRFYERQGFTLLEHQYVKILKG